MTTLIVLLTIETIAIAVLVGLLFSANKMIDAKHNLYINERNYADQLLPYYYELRDLQIKYGEAITELRIRSGELEAHKIGKIGTKNAYIMELPGMPAIDNDYRVTMADNGEINVNYDPGILYKGNKAKKIESPALFVTVENGMSKIDAMRFVMENLAASLIDALGRDSLTESELEYAANCVIEWQAKGYDSKFYAAWIMAEFNKVMPAKHSDNGKGKSDNSSNGKDNGNKSNNNGNGKSSDTPKSIFWVMIYDGLSLADSDKLPSDEYQLAKGFEAKIKNIDSAKAQAKNAIAAIKANRNGNH